MLGRRGTKKFLATCIHDLTYAHRLTHFFVRKKAHGKKNVLALNENYVEKFFIVCKTDQK